MAAEKKFYRSARFWIILCVALICSLPFLPMVLIIGYILLRAVILNLAGAFTTPEWGELEYLYPRDKVELVDGCSEVAGTMADGMMNRYIFRIEDEAERRAFDKRVKLYSGSHTSEVGDLKKIRLLCDHAEHFHGKRERNFSVSLPLAPGADWQKEMYVHLIPGDDGYYYASTWFTWRRRDDASAQPSVEHHTGRQTE